MIRSLIITLKFDKNKIFFSKIDIRLEFTIVENK